MVRMRVLLLLGCLVCLGYRAEGQDLPLVLRYERARFFYAVETLRKQVGDVIPPRAPEMLPVRPDPVVARIHRMRRVEKHRRQEEAHRRVVLGTLHWQKVEDWEAFRQSVRFTEWMNAGSMSAIDAWPTPWLRARLQALFGNPTRTAMMVYRDPDDIGPYPQFEYWFVINREIPLLVMDVSGPEGQGLVFVGSVDDAPILDVLVQDFTRQLLAAPVLAPYVDGYVDEETGRWYLTGYDGRIFFTLPMTQPDTLVVRPTGH